MASPRIEEVLRQSELPPASVVEVRKAIDSSPYLQAGMLTAIEDRHLKRFALSNDANEGGHYDRRTGTISINPDYFDIERGQQRLDALTSVIGHETGHALMARSAELTEYRYAFEVDKAIKEASRNGDSGVDITPLARDTIQDFRRNEALAELVSMNAVASRVAGGNAGQFDKAEFLKRADATTDCIDRRKLDAGIQLNDRGFQSTGGEIDSAAVERVAVCHFDQGSRTLGLKGTSSYDDTYAAYTLSAAADTWKDFSRGTVKPMPTIEVDLAALKTSKQGVENAGVELGGKGREFNFTDLSNGQRRPVGIKQLGDGAQNQPDRHAELAKTPLLADDPKHPDHGTFNRIHDWVRGTGQWDDEKSKNIAASLYKAQIADPVLQRVDKIVGGIGQNGEQSVFAVYAPHGDKPPMFHAQVDGREAAQQPAQQNLQQAEQIKQQQVQQQQLEQQQINQPTQKGPALTIG